MMVGNNIPSNAPTLNHVLYSLELVSDAPNGLVIKLGTWPLDGRDGMFTIGL